jgi:outer membrane biosynthesis protein TonB
VVRADPKGLFEDAALEAFRSAKFSPGMVLGTPVKSQITVEVEFLPINRGARISGRMY